MSEKLEKEFPEVVLHAIQQATNQSDHPEIPPLVTLPWTTDLKPLTKYLGCSSCHGMKSV